MGYSTGVKQGDKLAPIFLIIVMQSLVELIKKKKNENSIYIPQFNHNTNIFYNKGQLISYETKTRFLTKDKLFNFYALMMVLLFFQLKFVSNRWNDKA